MNIVIWIVQGLLALMMLMAGSMKVLRPKEQLAEMMGWVNDFSQGQIRLIGLAEVLGALGLILPMATGILPILTPLAATGLTILMLGAVYTHIRRNENDVIKRPLMPLLLAAFIAFGRFVILPA